MSYADPQYIATNPAERTDSPSRTRYRPLDWSKFETRFLKVYHNDFDSEFVICGLSHGSLLRPPDYVALSYAWGDPTVTTSIMLDGEMVSVTINLAAALKELAAQRVSLVWIDALCINQSDLYERSHQVLRMGQIYATATKVITWLGSASPTSDLAMRYLQFDDYARTRRQKFANYVKANYLLDAFDPVTGEISEKVERILRAVSQHQAHNPRPARYTNASCDGANTTDRDSGVDVEPFMEMEIDLEAGLDIPTDIANGKDPLQIMWNALAEFLERPYWSRSWIVQEVAKGRKVEIWCGNKHISFDDLFGALRDPLFHDHTTMIENLNYFRLREKQSRIGVARMLLSEAIVRTFSLKATDPRDKVYAILGLTLDGADAVPTPNYTQEVSAIFREVFKFIVATEGQTSMLLLAGKRQDQQGVPSWLPWLHVGGSTRYGNAAGSIKRRMLAQDLLPPEIPEWVVECVRTGRETLTFSTRISDAGLVLKAVLLTHISQPMLSGSDRDVEPSRKLYRGKDVDKDQVLRTMLDLWTFLDTGVMKPDADDIEGQEDSFRHAKDDVPMIIERLDTLVAVFLGLHGEEATDTVISLHRWYRSHCTWLFFDHAVEQWVDCYRKAISKATDFQLVDILSRNSHQQLHPLRLGAERLNDKQIQTVMTRDGAFRLVHRAALKDDGIWRLENCALPVVLRRNRLLNPPRHEVVGEMVMPIRPDFSHWTERTGWTDETFASSIWQTITII